MNKERAKRCLIFCLVLVSFAGCFGCACGEPNLTEQIRKESDFYVTGFISDSAVYLLGSKNLYIWRPEQEQAASIPLPSVQGRPLSCFLRGEDLWIIAPVGESGEPVQLFAVKSDITEDGRVEYKDAVKLDTDCLHLVADDSLSVFSSLDEDGTVYMIVSVSNGERQMLRCGLAAGDTVIIKNDNVGKRLFAAGGGRILTECIDEEAGKAWYELYDPQSRSFTKQGGVFEYDRMKGGMVGAAWDAAKDCLYYQEGSLLKAAENADPDSTTTVASVLRPCEIAGQTAGIIGSRYYVYLSRDGAEVIDIDDYRERRIQFKVMTNSRSEAIIAALGELQKRHPEIMPVIDTVDPSDYEIIDRLVKWQDDTDVYVAQSGTLLSELVYLREFMLEITEPSIVEAVAKMYPAVQEAVTHGGKIICVPVSVSGETIGVNREILEKLDGPDAELPSDFAELLERLEELDLKTNGQEEFSIFPLYMPERSIRTGLIYSILEAYCKEFVKDLSAGYHTPELIAALEKAMSIDLQKMGINGETDDKDRLYLVSPLMTSMSPTTCVEYRKDEEPLAVYISKNAQPGIPIDITAAFINPYGRNPALAQEFMAEVIKHWDTTTQYTLSDEKNDPVLDPEIVEQLEKLREQRGALSKKAESASEEDKTDIRERLAFYDSEIEFLEQRQWLLSRESIDRFRANADKLYVRSYNYAGSGETARLVQQLVDGIISADEFTRAVDKEIDMIYSEGF